VNAQEQKAVERFKALLVLDVQRSAYGHEILAYYYRDRGEIDQEAEEWKKALSVIYNERYLVNLGGSYMELGKYQEAIAAFKRAVDLNPNSADGYYNLGLGFARIGSYQEAEKHYRMAIDKDPYLLDAYTNLGGLFIGTGDHQKAVEILNSAIQKDPDYFPAYYNVAVAYSRMGRTQDGIQLLRAYLKRNPEDHERVRQLLRKMNISLD
jgi:tetratricopeptide (TPR) repeat protein